MKITFLLGLGAFMLGGGLFAQDNRQEVPDPARHQSAQKLIRDLFKEDYAKRSPQDMQTLAKKLIRQALETKDDPTARYVLLSESQDLAIQAGDVDTTLNAIREMSAMYRVGEAALKGAALSALGKTAKTPADLKALAHSYMSLTNTALLEDDFDTAEKSIQSASALARRAKDVSLVGSTASKEKEVASRKQHFEIARKARETLAKDPEDPTASGVVGRYLCLTKRDWERGLSLLAKGPESGLRSAALKDLSRPASAQDQEDLGDEWWALSEKEPGDAKEPLHERATHWYKQALDQLTGLARAKAEKRMSQTIAEKLGKGSWVDFSDPANFGLTGKQGEPIELVKGTKTGSRFASKAFPPGVFDGVTVRIRFKPNTPGKGSFTFGGTYVAGSPINYTLCNIDSQNQLFFGPALGPSGKIEQIQTPCPRRDSYVLTMFINGGEPVVYLDGEEVRRWKGPPDKLDMLAIWVLEGAVQFDQIKLRRKE